MCGRFYVTRPPAAVASLFNASGPTPNAAPRWNVAPTQDALVVRFNPETRTRHLDSLRWGLVPRWAKDVSIGSRMINARGESLAEKPAFRDAFAKRRAIVPVDGFYEWRTVEGTRTKQAYAVALTNGDPMALAGLWEGWRAPDGTILRSFTIVTTDANAKLAALHERMPVVLHPDAWPLWLGEEPAGDPALLLKPAPAEEFSAWPVAARVGNVRNDDAALVEHDGVAAPLPGLDDPPVRPP